MMGDIVFEKKLALVASRLDALIQSTGEDANGRIDSLEQQVKALTTQINALELVVNDTLSVLEDVNNTHESTLSVIATINSSNDGYSPAHAGALSLGEIVASPDFTIEPAVVKIGTVISGASNTWNGTGMQLQNVASQTGGTTTLNGLKVAIGSDGKYAFTINGAFQIRQENQFNDPGFPAQPYRRRVFHIGLGVNPTWMTGNGQSTTFQRTKLLTVVTDSDGEQIINNAIKNAYGKAVLDLVAGDTVYLIITAADMSIVAPFTGIQTTRNPTSPAIFINPNLGSGVPRLTVRRLLVL